MGLSSGVWLPLSSQSYPLKVDFVDCRDTGEGLRGGRDAAGDVGGAVTYVLSFAGGSRISS